MTSSGWETDLLFLTNGNELWKTDGTADGTTLLKVFSVAQGCVPGS